MDIYNILLNNKNFLEYIYAFIISCISLMILFKTDRYFRLSLHNGLRYFRNSFLFYGLAFFWKFILADLTNLNTTSIFFSQFIFEYLLIMGGLFLLYSLIWKKFDLHKITYSSLINSKIVFLHLIAIILSLFDSFFESYKFLFISQILIFSFSIILFFKNYKKNEKKSSLPKIYILALSLGLIAWILNFFTAKFFKWNTLLLIDIGILNIIFFILILFSIFRITKIKKYKNGN
jgi:hypothetical protein